MRTRNNSKSTEKKKPLTNNKNTKTKNIKNKNKDKVSYRESHNLGRRKSSESVVTYSLNSRLFFDVYAKYSVDDSKKINNTFNDVKIENEKSDCSSTKAQKRKIKEVSDKSIINNKVQKVEINQKLEDSRKAEDKRKAENNQKAENSCKAEDIRAENSQKESKVNNEISSKSKTFQQLMGNKTIFKKHLSKSLPGVKKAKKLSLVLNSSNNNNVQECKIKENGVSNTDKTTKDNLIPPQIVPNETEENSDQLDKEIVKNSKSLTKKSIPKSVKKAKKSEIDENIISMDVNVLTRVKRVASLNAAAIISCVHSNARESPKKNKTDSNGLINGNKDDLIVKESILPNNTVNKEICNSNRSLTSKDLTVKNELEESDCKMKKNDMEEDKKSSNKGNLVDKEKTSKKEASMQENNKNSDMGNKIVELKLNSSTHKSKEKNKTNLFFDITKNVKQKTCNLPYQSKSTEASDVVKKETTMTNGNSSGKKTKKKMKKVEEMEMKAEEERSEDDDKSYWLWNGEGVVRNIQLLSKGEFVEKLCYSAIKHSRDDVVIRMNDCVLMRSSDNEPFVGKISSFFNDDVENKKMMTVYWYYRPENTELGRLHWHGEADLYASQHLDTNCVDCIEDKAFVLPVEMFARFSSYQRRQTTTTRPNLSARLVPHNNDDLSLPMDSPLRPQNDLISTNNHSSSNHKNKSHCFLSAAHNAISDLYFTPSYMSSFPTEMVQSNVFVCRGIHDIYNNTTTHKLHLDSWLLPTVAPQSSSIYNNDNNNNKTSRQNNLNTNNQSNGAPISSSSCATTPCCFPSNNYTTSNFNQSRMNNTLNETSSQPNSPADSAMSISSVDISPNHIQIPNTNGTNNNNNNNKNDNNNNDNNSVYDINNISPTDNENDVTDHDSSATQPPLPISLPPPPPPPPLSSPPSPPMQLQLINSSSNTNNNNNTTISSINKVNKFLPPITTLSLPLSISTSTKIISTSININTNSTSTKLTASDIK